MSNELYHVTAWQASGDAVNCGIRFNPASSIFEGHFPGNPIVPGVCTLQMVRNLLEQATGKKLRLVHASSIKYLQLITPGMEPEAGITWKTSGNTFTAMVALKEGGTTLFKMAGLYEAIE